MHETLNIAALWRLPLVLACINNGYAVSTPVRASLATTHLTDLAGPYRIPAIAVDGPDVDAVALATADAVASARAGHGAFFLELRCARLATHSTLTREERAPAELEQLRDRDPLPLYEQRLRRETILNDALWMQLRTEVDAEIAQAERCAQAAPGPMPRRHCSMPKRFFRAALARAMAEEMEREPRLILLGQDIAAHGGSYAETRGLFERFGPSRVRNTPVAEAVTVGMAAGAVAAGGELEHPAAEQQHVEQTRLGDRSIPVVEPTPE